MPGSGEVLGYAPPIVDETSRIAALLRRSALSEAAAQAGGARIGPPLGGGTSGRVIRIDRGGRPVAVAKLGSPSLPGRRVDAESHVLGVIGPRAGLPTPMRLARVDEDLLIAWAGAGARAESGARSEPGQVAAPPAEAILDALAVVHAAPLVPDDHRWLAPWGRGTAGAQAPFARRARRVARRAEGFLALLPPDQRAPWAARLAFVVDRFPAACAAVRDLPHHGLLHGDMHPGHAIAGHGGSGGSGGSGGLTLIDWQHASIGPAAVDVARLLVEHGPAGADAVELLATRHLRPEARAIAGDLVVLVMGGLVSGFGGRRTAALAPWERAIVDRAIDADGWAAACLDAARRRRG